MNKKELLKKIKDTTSLVDFYKLKESIIKELDNESKKKIKERE